MTRWIMAAALVLAVEPARADCDHFKWSLAQEKAWFSQTPEPIDSGAEANGGRAYEIALKPEDAANYPEPPKKKTPGAFGAVVRVSALAKPGLYQITLTREGWIDVIQNGARARTRNISRQRDCAAYVKSVRFELGAGAAVLEFSGVGEPSLGFSLAPAE